MKFIPDFKLLSDNISFYIELPGTYICIDFQFIFSMITLYSFIIIYTIITLLYVQLLEF